MVHPKVLDFLHVEQKAEAPLFQQNQIGTVSVPNPTITLGPINSSLK